MHPFSFFSFLCYWHDQILIITPGSAILEFWRKKQTKKKQQTKKQEKSFGCVFNQLRSALKSSAVLELTTEGERLFLCGIVRGEKRSQDITVCLVSTILGTVWWPGRFQTVSRGQVLVFFYRHSTRMCLMKEKQGGTIPTGLQRWPLKLIKHFADTPCVSPSPAGPTGCCPLNFLYLINLGKGSRWVLHTLV